MVMRVPRRGAGERGTRRAPSPRTFTHASHKAAARGREEPVSLTPQRPGATDDDLNPHRADDQARVAAEIRGNLRQRGVVVRDEEAGEELVATLEAVERFERARSALGGDSMLNSPGTRQPEREEFVIPRRSDDESLRKYASRVEEAARKLGASRSD
jgi:hypothetical protein